MFTSTAYAQTAAGSTGDLQNQLLTFAPMILIFVVCYFLLLRPQQQRAKDLKTQQEGLRRGDRVVTAGGIIGTISRVINAEELEVQIAEAVRVRVLRNTISTVQARTEPAKAEAAEDASPVATEGEIIPPRRRRAGKA